jgi:PST family polysaccharide transporter
MTPFNTSGEFKPVTGGLRRLAVRGVAATLFSSGSGLVIQIVSTVILARLLTPTDFGLVTMVTTFSLLLANFGYNGITEAIIQWEDLNHTVSSNLFWINFAAGVLLTAAFAGAGSLLGILYGDPRVVNVAIGMSFTIFFQSTWVLHTALLRRAMQFSAVSANEIVAKAVSLIVSVVMARQGWGYWALVGGNIALPVSTTIGALILCRWIPSLPRRISETSSMLRFAINVYGRFTVNYCARNVDNLLVGWRFSAQSLGFYKKAYDLFALSASQLTAPLTVVAVSALSRLNRDSVQFRRYLLSALGVVTFIGMGLGMDLTLIGSDVIRLLLGPGWEPSGRIFTFFGPGIGIMLLYSTHGWIHLSIGRADRWFRWGLVEFALTFLLFLVTIHWGPVGIAFAWTASFWILTGPALWYAGKPINLEISAVIGAVWKYVAAAVSACYGCAMIFATASSSAAPAGSVAVALHIVTVSIVFCFLYLAAVIVLHGGCKPLYQLARLLQEMIPVNFLRPSPSIAVANAGE